MGSGQSLLNDLDFLVPVCCFPEIKSINPLELSTVTMTEQGCKLFIYGIDQGMQNSKLKAEFDKFGNVVDVHNTGKGFAFVTFDQQQDAQTAIREMNGATVNGQQIKVNEAKPREGRLLGWMLQEIHKHGL